MMIIVWFDSVFESWENIDINQEQATNNEYILKKRKREIINYNPKWFSKNKLSNNYGMSNL